MELTEKRGLTEKRHPRSHSQQTRPFPNLSFTHKRGMDECDSNDQVTSVPHVLHFDIEEHYKSKVFLFEFIRDLSSKKIVALVKTENADAITQLRDSIGYCASQISFASDELLGTIKDGSPLGDQSVQHRLEKDAQEEAVEYAAQISLRRSDQDASSTSDISSTTDTGTRRSHHNAAQSFFRRRDKDASSTTDTLSTTNTSSHASSGIKECRQEREGGNENPSPKRRRKNPNKSRTTPFNEATKKRNS